jgi:hypothetical protein
VVKSQVYIEETVFTGLDTCPNLTGLGGKMQPEPESRAEGLGNLEDGYAELSSDEQLGERRKVFSSCLGSKTCLNVCTTLIVLGKFKDVKC